MTLPARAAYYGLGALFPVVIVDPHPNWHQPSPGALPERGPQGQDLLALRWSAPGTADDTAANALFYAAQRAPSPLEESGLRAYQARLPQELRLIALSPSTLIGPWAARPGRTARLR